MADFASTYIDHTYKQMKAGLDHKQPTDDQFAAIFYGYTEISETLDSLSLSERLIGLAPPRAKSIDRDKYLKFLVSAYLQDVYILEQRLTAYGKKISRLYGKPALPPVVQRLVYDPLEGIIGTRGAHVHSRRFSDEHLDGVSTLALFRKLGHQLGEDLEFAYTLAQHEWKLVTKKNNVAIRKIVDQYFGVLQAVMVSNDQIVFPPSGRKSSKGRNPECAPDLVGRKSEAPSDVRDSDR